MRADGNAISGDIVAIRDGVLELQPEGEGTPAAKLEAGQWIRWGHPVQPLPQPRIHLFGGTLLVAKRDWAGKVPIRIEGDTVTIQTGLLGSVKLERAHVKCMLISAAKEPSIAGQLLAEADQPVANADRIWLVDGDMLRGQVVGFDGTQLEFALGNKPVSILAFRIAAVAFAQTPLAKPVNAEPAFLVGLADGSFIKTPNLSVNEKAMTVTSLHGQQWNVKQRNSLVFVQSLASGVVYLSDLQPVEYHHTPYFEATWQLAQNHTLTGDTLAAGGQRYSKGLGMHSAARVVYRIPEGAKQFCAEVAIDDSTNGRGSVVFRVYLFKTDEAGQGGLTSVYESPVVRGGEAPRSIQVDLAGASAIVLVVDYADFGDERDHADWLDARLVW